MFGNLDYRFFDCFKGVIPINKVIAKLFYVL